MTIKQYKSFFDEIAQFQKKQAQQKQRGLNNYNILTSVLDKSDEVRLHSRMLYSLLDPNGQHYQDNLFLDEFLKILSVEKFNINSKNCSIYKEHQSIDLYITDGNNHIIIENKIYAPDQEKQIERYVNTIKSENSDVDSSKILVLYLSLDKHNPSKSSLGDLSIENGFLKNGENEEVALFKSISYKKEMMIWLKKCQYEVQNITNLNEVFNQYIDVIKMINNEHTEKIMSLSDYIKNDKSKYQMALQIQMAIPEARKKIVENFFNKIIQILQNKLGEDWTVEIDGDLSTKWEFPFKIYKNKWKSQKGNHLLFGFEFQKKEYFDGCFGIVKQDEIVNIENVVKTFETPLAALDLKLNSSKWWLHFAWLPNTEETIDFAQYILCQPNTETEFIKTVINTINIFELNPGSGLITKINEYLSETK